MLNTETRVLNKKTQQTERAQLDGLTTPPALNRCRVVVIWIDWYAYHVARFRGLLTNPALAGSVAGIELVGGVGVHAGLKFREELPADVPVETLMPGSNWSEAGQLKLAGLLWNRLTDLDPEVVLVPGYYTLPAIVAALWARLHRRKSVLMTESTEGDHLRSWWKEALKGALIRNLFDWAVAGGKQHAAYLKVLGFRADRVAGFYDVVDNNYFRDRCSDLRLHSTSEFIPAKPYFLFVGRLAEEKNVSGLLTSYFLHRASGGDWQLVLVGDGPESESLQRLAAESPYRSDIKFVGHKNSGELPKYYAFAGCFVLPSVREPWGLVVNEAMAARLPVIVSNRCGCAADLVIHGKTGFTFDPAKSQELTDCLGLIESFSADKLAAMGSQAGERVGLYSPQEFAREIERIVEA